MPRSVQLRGLRPAVFMAVLVLAATVHVQRNPLAADKGGNQEPDKVYAENVVTVALNETRAGGTLSRSDILCETVLKLNSDQGWVQISAEATNKKKVEGWLHRIYDAKLNLQCGEAALGKEIETAEATGEQSDSSGLIPTNTNLAKNIDASGLAAMLSGLLQNHGLVKAAQSDLAAATDRRREAWGAWFPNLVVGGHWAYEDNNKAPGSDDTGMYARGLDLTATQLLWDFGGANAAVRIAGLTHNIAEDNLEVARQDLLLRAITAYLNVKRFGDVLELAKQSEANIKKQTELENALVRRGAGLSSDVMQAKQQLAAASALRVQSRGQLLVARNNYRAVFRTEAPPYTKMSITKVPTGSLPASLEEAVEIAGRENPKLTVAATSYNLTREASKVVRGALLPRLEAVGTAKHKDNQGGTAGIAEEYSGKVQLTWPINLGLTAVNTLSAANSDATATSLRVAEQRHLVEEQVRNSWDSLQTARATSEFLRNQANIAAEFLEVARKERKMGNRSLLDVLAGETALINANSAARSAETDIRLFSFTLLNAIGRMKLETVAD